jgi:hypothetical protein
MKLDDPIYLPGYSFLRLGEQVWLMGYEGMQPAEIHHVVCRALDTLITPSPRETVLMGHIWYVMVDRAGVALEVVARLSPAKLRYLHPFVPPNKNDYIRLLDWAARNTLKEIQIQIGKRRRN